MKLVVGIVIGALVVAVVGYLLFVWVMVRFWGNQ